MTYKVLNLFAGKYGGNRALWSSTEYEITAIELNPENAQTYQSLYPNDKVIIGDATEFIRDKSIDLNQFDFIWASPPCQRNSQMMKFYKNTEKRKPLPNLDQTIGLYFWLKTEYKGLFCIENVQPWFKWLLDPVKIDRHLFWVNFPLKSISFIDNHSNKHGKIGGIMRDKTKKTPEQRDMVNPEIGLYIIESALKKRKNNLDDLL